METDRYRSRILREVQANRVNPFNSPPSSTGSRGSNSPTLSSVFSDPDGESTRRLHADIARVTAPRKLPVNWEAAHRKWPEFFSAPSKEANDSTTDPLRPPTRADMQPRVENESDLSPALRSNMASPQPKTQAQHLTFPPQKPQRRSSITEAIDRLRRASLSPPVDAQSRLPARESISPSAKSSLTAVAPSPAPADDHSSSSFVRSFLMPDVSHLGDFVTGTLKFSGSMKNGVPIFVKNGRVHDRRERPYTDAHAAVDGIEVPQVEEKIFVSMDMIRNEIVSLQKHHDQVQHYAETLQKQVQSLEAQVKSGKHLREAQGDKQTDSRLITRNNELEQEVASLKAKLDASHRKATESEMEKMTLAHEKDRAVSRLQSACDDISKLTRKLSIRDRELETTDQVRQDNDTLRRDLLSLKHGRDGLERENASLRTDNAALRTDNEDLRREIKQLKQEVESLRADNKSLRRGDESLVGENRSLRSSNKSLMAENEQLRDSLDGVQHELDASHEQVERLERRVDSLTRDKTTLENDKAKLVQHNEKYFNDNKTLRREKSNQERSTHELRDMMHKLRDEVDFLKQQPDHCRPLASREDDFSARLDDETEENMTSAFFVPDITINTNDEATETAEVAVELTSRSQTTAKETDRTSKRRGSGSARPGPSQPKVAFAVPDKDQTAQSDKNVANKGSKRRNPARKPPARDADDTTDGLSVDLCELPKLAPTKRKTTTSIDPSSTCPAALSPDARRVLDGLCQHNCRNCIVCTRITSHAGIVTAADLSAGKKRISLSRPVPVTDRPDATEDDQDATTRPSQPPGQALALVIKGLEDEAQHMQLDLSTLQARYKATDKSLGRRHRVSLADEIRSLLRRLEAKNDQIYSLFDVLEGQKAAGQAMTEDEVELTVLSITGLTVRDLAGGAGAELLASWGQQQQQ
ncbi:hypothetical protein CDD80_3853 [Ophiocordyceps camponoti-rufipedis]|uniref:Cep57 centrosome microtubule-binding domain-containing protein n=1 Tax=Ophiocordyceps camponoti-rufipedis TaxID=2004952 RepID=A0A2C5Z0R4_9HYPO|nr:hypothetical protein CDD80_3853 [Ophiocordyceps camponoti-rufipedis]